jgi:hypothetical protein
MFVLFCIFKIEISIRHLTPPPSITGYDFLLILKFMIMEIAYSIMKKFAVLHVKPERISLFTLVSFSSAISWLAKLVEISRTQYRKRELKKFSLQELYIDFWKLNGFLFRDASTGCLIRELDFTLFVWIHWLNIAVDSGVKKCIALRVTGRLGKQVCEMLRLPHTLKDRFTDGGEVSFTRRPRLTPRGSSSTNLC